MELKKIKIGTIGLGYVGLPLAVEFAKVRPVVGFDINKTRIKELKSGYDRTGEITAVELHNSSNLKFSDTILELKTCNFYIITVPTPIDCKNNPDLSALKHACELVGDMIQKNDIIVFESTVYPGCTEEFCVPILERLSSLKINEDFSVGYSPERINPGDKTRSISSIVKITSGSNSQAAIIIDKVYGEIVKVGTHKAESIKIAEAAKVIENTQRDLNIALVNELSLIFEKLEIDTNKVLDAAETKWNFLPFRPGLVGGHCIGVDPYYLTHKAKEVGLDPKVILAGREVNSGMWKNIVARVKSKLKDKVQLYDAEILCIGLTFKENCPDLRNSQIPKIIKALENDGMNIDVYDPIANPRESMDHYKIEITNNLPNAKYDCIIAAVAHDEVKNLDLIHLISMLKHDASIFDIKNIFEYNPRVIKI